jgi:8-oxo-dGTP pyrophosphatase MutT (NUDIX family)
MADPLFVVNVQVVVSCGRAVLFLRRGADETHAPGIWDVPGGKVEYDDLADAVLESAARREISEETGLHLDGPLNYVTSTSFVADDGVRVVNVVFSCRVDQRLTPTTGDEEEAAQWVDLDGPPPGFELMPWTAAYLSAAMSARSE